MTEEEKIFLFRLYDLLLCGKTWEAKHLIGVYLGLESSEDFDFNESFEST